MGDLWKMMYDCQSSSHILMEMCRQSSLILLMRTEHSVPGHNIYLYGGNVFDNDRIEGELVYTEFHWDLQITRSHFRGMGRLRKIEGKYDSILKNCAFT